MFKILDNRNKDPEKEQIKHKNVLIKTLLKILVYKLLNFVKEIKNIQILSR